MPGKPQLEIVEGFGDRVAAILRRHPSIGTVTALGKAAGLSRQTLHRAMNEDTLTLETARAVAAALDEDMQGLLDGVPSAGSRGGLATAPIQGGSTVSRQLKRMVHDFLGEAHRTGATVEDMDYLVPSLSDENILRYVGPSDGERLLSSEEEVQELAIRLDELRAWLKRRIEIRRRGRR